MAFDAKRYVFTDVRSFNEKRSTLVATPKPFIRFGEAYDMQGLSYVSFSHPVSFTSDNGQGNIADITGNMDISLDQILGETKKVFGLSKSRIVDLQLMDPVRLVDLTCIYRHSSNELVISDYNLFEKPEKVVYRPRRLDAHNGSGFA
ncbi:MAG: hypothetical protein WCK29_04805 [archaeon]